MSESTTMVGGEESDTEEKVKGRSVYEGVRNDESKLTTAPADWDRKKHKPLGKEDFSDEPTYFEHAANMKRAAGNRMIASADSLLKKAEDFRKYGDPVKRKKAAKLAKYREEIKALEAELEGDLAD